MYKMDNNTIFNPAKAKRKWGKFETGVGFLEALYETSKGNYVIEYITYWQGQRDTAEYVSKIEALKWLVHHDEEVPEELQKLLADIEE